MTMNGSTLFRKVAEVTDVDAIAFLGNVGKRVAVLGGSILYFGFGVLRMMLGEVLIERICLGISRIDEADAVELFQIGIVFYHLLDSTCMVLMRVRTGNNEEPIPPIKKSLQQGFPVQRRLA